MTRTDGHLQRWLGLYVLGGLSPEEDGTVEEHLGRCGPCRAVTAEFGEVRAFLDLLSPDDVDALSRTVG